VGPLDDHLFYFNDADYCKRLWDAGREVVCLPHVRATHHDHAGGSMIDTRTRFRSLRVFHVGAYRYYRKHGGHSAWHPYSWLVVGALGARFAASGALQLGHECVGLVSARPRPPRSTPPRRQGAGE